jgi:hypothetical protein
MQSEQSQSEPLTDSIDNLPESDSDVFGKSERIDKKDIKPLNDPNCEHEFVEEPDCEIPGCKSMKCTKCPVGIFVKK